MVNALTETPVKASISTPVFSLHFTVQRISKVFFFGRISICTFDKFIWWQRGISSEVFLTAWIPAITAVCMILPFLPKKSCAAKVLNTCGGNSTRPEAVAVREVTVLSETSTIVAFPDSSTWESFLFINGTILFSCSRSRWMTYCCGQEQNASASDQKGVLKKRLVSSFYRPS